MESNTWMPKIAGILDIIAGAFGLIGLLMVGLGIMFFSIAETSNTPMPIGAAGIMVIFWGIAIPMLLIDILAIVGGVYALKKRIWGLALAGSIAALFSSFLLGIASIIFTVMGKDQFE
jgi:hypothetical protein